jgi:hypothetical protein
MASPGRGVGGGLKHRRKEIDIMHATRTPLLCAALAALALLVGAWGTVRAADDNISFKKRGEKEKEFVTNVGKAIVTAAHKTGKKVALVEYKIETPKANRTNLKIKMEYYGAVSKKRYVADIVVKIDSTDKEKWECLNIEYTDNNKIKHSETKVQALIKEFNK